MVALGVCLAWSAGAAALSPSLDVTQYAHTAWGLQDDSLKAGVRAIAQTPDGYLWLGTEFGVVRFDGVRFMQWNPPPGQHLPSTNIRSLLSARDGALWIGTVEGLARLRDGKLTEFPEFSHRSVLSLREDRQGTLWAGSFGVPHGRLCAIQNDNARCYGDDGAFGQWVWSLYPDRAGRFWAGTQTGLWLLEPGPPKRYSLPHAIDTEQALLETDDGSGLLAIDRDLLQVVDGKVSPHPIALPPGPLTFVNMFRDRDGGLWLGTMQRGVLRVHNGRTSTFAQSDGLSGNRVLTFFEDREGNIWVGTADGLDRFRETSVHSISARQGLSDPSVQSVLVARDNSVWLSTLNGLNRWKDGLVTVYWPDGRASQNEPTAAPQNQPAFYTSARIKPVTEIHDSGMPDVTVGSLYEDDLGRIWVSTPQGIARFENGRFHRLSELPAGWVNAIVGDTQRGVWISYQDQGLLHWPDGKAIETFPWSTFGRNVVASSVAVDAARGGLWLGFFQGGLAYFRDGKVTASFGHAEGLGGGRVMGLHLDPDGSLWAATEGGLSHLKNGRIATLNSANGLPCDTVHWAEESAGSFWLYTACGLLSISRAEIDNWISNSARKVQFMLLDRSDGVRSRALLAGYTPRVSQSADGRLWFANLQSVSVVDPKHLVRNTTPPPVHIEQITADSKVFSSSNSLRLPARVRDLTIDFTALSLAAPEKVRFRFMLEGQDPGWREVVNDRKVQYSNLSPARYRFQVMACNNTGIWNETGDKLEFEIPPAWFQTMAFRALCVAAFVALVWGVYRLRLLQLRRQEEQFREAVETLPEMAFIVGSDGRRQFVNRRWVDYTGVPPEQAAGMPIEQVVHSDDAARVAERWRFAISHGQPLEYETRIRRGSDGAFRWFLTRAVPVRDRQGRVLKWCGVSVDIQDRKLAEQLQTELEHVNRISTLGELAASISHELKQPIAAAMLNASVGKRWLKRDAPGAAKTFEALDLILKDGRRASEIIDRLRAFYKKGPAKREPLAVNNVITEMAAMLRNEATQRGVSIRTDLVSTLPLAEADRVQLQQVLMNLMLNAIEAMKDTGGVLSIHSQLDEDGRILISVHDTGVGVPPDISSRIFDAFFTTKAQGSGMGLAISRSIVESHGGNLWAKPNGGRGATFCFTLPAAGQEAAMEAGAR